MKKLSKKLLISITTIIIFASILLGIWQKEEIAKGIGTNALLINSAENTYKTIEQLKAETDWYVNTGIIRNKNVLCVNNGAPLNFSYHYNIEKKYEINSQQVKIGSETYTDIETLDFGQKVAYILNQSNYNTTFSVYRATANLNTYSYKNDSTRNLTKTETPKGTEQLFDDLDDAKTNPVQIALWHLIQTQSSTLTNKFNFIKSSDDHYRTTKEVKINYDENVTTNAIRMGYDGSVYNYVISEEAYEIYTNALKYNTFGKAYEAKYYMFGDSEADPEQQVIIFENGETIDNPIKFNFNLTKNKPTGAALSGAKFQIDFYNGTSATGTAFTTTTATTNSSGKIEITDITPPNTTTVAITAKITETEAPEGYTKISPFTIAIKRDNTSDSTWEIDNSNGNGMTFSNSPANELSATIKEATDITELKLIKTTGASDTKVSGATFKATFTNVDKINGIATTTYTGTTNSSGELIIEHIVPTDTSKTINVKLEETNTPPGFMKVGDVSFDLIYDANTGYWKQKTPVNSLVSVSGDNNETTATVTIKEPATIRQLDLIKVSRANNSQVGTITQAKFDLEFQNVKNVKFNGSVITPSSGTTVKLTDKVTDSSGKIAIDEIVPDSTSSTVYMIITEKDPAPTGRSKLASPIKLKSTYNSSTCLWETTIDNNPNTEYVNVSSSNGDITLTIEDYSIIKELNINKVNSQDNSIKINNAIFTATIENVSNIETIPIGSNMTITNNVATITNLNTGTSGGFKLSNLKIYDITKPVEITLDETGNPTGYASLDGTIVIKLNYNQSTGKMEKNSYTTTGNISQEEFDPLTDVTLSNDIVNVTIGNKSVIRNFTVEKLNSQDNTIKMPDAEFEVTIDNAKEILGMAGVTYSGDKAILNEVTDANGKFILPDIVIKDITKNITISLKETKAPLGYKRIKDTVYVELEYNPSTGELTKVKDNTKTNTYNVIGVEEFKAANINSDRVSFDLTNIPVMNLGGIAWEDKEYGSKEDSEGSLQPANGIYKSKDTDKYDVLLPNIPVSLYKIDGTNITKVTQDIYGRNLMTKTATYGDTYTYDTNTSDATITLKDGQYIFPNIELGYSYYIEFEYDGIKYIEYKEMSKREKTSFDENGYKSNTGNISDTTEVERQTFNDKFATISGPDTHSTVITTTTGKATNVSGSIVDLLYNNKNKTDSKGEALKDSLGNPVRESKINTINGSTGLIASDYIMKAKTDSLLPNGKDWKQTWKIDGTINIDDNILNLDCGLVQQNVDLSLKTDVNSATVTINGKKTDYTYNDLQSSENIIDLAETPTYDKDVKYNLYLYKSDYKYRIDDYLAGGIINNVNSTDKDDIEAEVNDDINLSQELEVYVKYAILLNNQSSTTSKIQEIVDYYDSNYSLVTSNIEGIANAPEFGKRTESGKIKILGNLNTSIATNKQTIDGVDYNKINITGMGDTYIGPAEQLIIYLTFKVNKTGDRFVTLGEKANIAEILSYSTYSTTSPEPSSDADYKIAGKIDSDSAPNNCIKNGTLVYEDDTDEAKGINITLPPEENIRKVTGQVWEDANNDGILQESESLINDVIVQLIELKDLTVGENTYQLEYIWQEMTTSEGETLLKYLDYDGKSIKGKTVNLGTGKYEFNDMVPGNYVIRYIYGDGRIYDYDTNTDGYLATNNIKKYNGYDYQSTIMDKEEYKKEYMNLNSSRDLSKNEALDNEARRLEVMGYSTYIDKEKGNKLATNSDEALKATWMCAETRKINLNVEYNSNEVQGQINPYNYILNDVKCGLSQRPSTKVELDKHITGLRITAANGKVIIDTFNNINNGLIKTDSTRTAKNSWTVETDKELLQGATLEVQYTYTIKNASDQDYLNETLINKFKTLSITDYNKYLSSTNPSALGLAQTIKKSILNKSYGASQRGTYLGQYYYTKVKSDTDKLVGFNVNKIEEYLNNELIFDMSTVLSSDFNKTNSNIQTAKTINDLKTLNITETLKNEIKSELQLVPATQQYTKTEEFNAVLQNKNATGYLESKGDTKNYNLVLKRVISPNTTIEDLTYESYLAEILDYATPTGRRDIKLVPGNVTYRHSNDSRISLESGFNEPDETWAEDIILRDKTGKDKKSIIEISIIAISSVAIIATGTILIKKYVISKK